MRLFCPLRSVCLFSLFSRYNKESLFWQKNPFFSGNEGLSLLIENSVNLLISIFITQIQLFVMHTYFLDRYLKIEYCWKDGNILVCG